MHDYLRAVGFSKVQHKRDLQLDWIWSWEALTVSLRPAAAVVCRMRRSAVIFVSNAGITVRGEVMNMVVQL